MNITELFDASLTGRAGTPALEYTDADALRTLTFGDIEARANRMANELAARGVVAGDRLCVHLGNGIGFLDLFLACTRLGVIMVPINILYRVLELQHIVADAEPRATVVHAGSNASYPAGATLWTIDELEAATASRSARRPTADTDDTTPALIIYTSGTTGKAKGAVLSHGNLIANGKVLVDAWRITESDRYLAVLPLFHVHGLANGVHSWLISGCRMRLCERFEQQEAAAWFRAFRPTLFFGVPTIYVRLLETSVISAAEAREIGAMMRLFVSGSAPLIRRTHEAFKDRFGHAILERYGMSEALMITSNPYDGERRAGTVGQPLPGVAVRLVSEDGTPASSGGVQIRSPALFHGYWRNEAATKAAFTPDGWFKTGDLGERSDDGYYTLLGRSHDLIISGGFNIYPAEIEQLLLERAGVKEAAVVGAMDPARGEVPIAYFVGRATAEELLLACKRSLASFKVPRAFVRIDALPRTALGKVQKHLLPPWKP